MTSSSPYSPLISLANIRSPPTNTQSQHHQQQHGYDSLPQHVVLQVYSHLDAKTISTAAQSCSHFNKAAHEAPQYKQYHQHISDYHKRQLRRKHIAMGRMALKWMFFSRAHEAMFFNCLFLFPIFLGLKLDQDVDWSWNAVFSPLLGVFLQLFFAPLAYLIASRLLKHDYSTDFCPTNSYAEDCYPPLDPERLIMPKNSDSDSIFFSYLFMDYIKDGNRLLLFTPIASLALFFALLLLQLNGKFENALPTVVPLFILVCYCFVFSANQPQLSYRSLVTCGGPPLFIFVVLLCVKLSSSHIPWAAVMGPLLAFTTYFLIVSALMYATNKKEDSIWETLQAPTPNLKIMGLVGIPVLLSILLSEILLTVHLEADIFSFKAIFSPVYLVEGLSIAASIVVHVDHACKVYNK